MSLNLPYESIDLPGIFIAGLALRTTNEHDRAQTDIAGLWAKFAGEDIAGQITSRVSDDLYCVYTDYENDYRGWYTTLLGCRVTSPMTLRDCLRPWFPGEATAFTNHRVMRPDV